MLLVALVLLNFGEAFAREAPEAAVFNSNLHKVVLKIDRETEARVLNGETGKIREFCFFQKAEDANPKVCLNGSSYRVRGNTSANRVKRQFKVMFGEAAPFLGMRAINLRSGGFGTNDDSMARELFASRIFGSMAYRLAHAKFFVEYCDNGVCGARDYKGLYMLAENIDTRFLQARFGDNPAGVLVSSAYVDDNARADFTPERMNAKSYEIDYSTLSDEQTAKILAGFSGELEKCSTQLVRERGYARKAELAGRMVCSTLMRLQEIVARRDVLALKRLFDMESVYNYMAAVNFTGHWDSLLANANNDFLFFNPKIGGEHGGKWQLLVWDLDNTIGSMAAEQASAGHLQFPVHTPNVLFKYILSEPVLREEYEKAYRLFLVRTDRAQLLNYLTQLEATVKNGTGNTWEESVGIDYSAAFNYLRQFVSERHAAVTRSLGF